MARRWGSHEYFIAFMAFWVGSLVSGGPHGAVRQLANLVIVLTLVVLYFRADRRERKAIGRIDGPGR